MSARIYVAGPMRGRPQFNFPAFQEGAQEAVALFPPGHAIAWSPADHDIALYGADVFMAAETGSSDELPPDFSMREALAADLSWLSLNATHIYMLRGWENSSGARAERATAMALGIEVLYQPDAGEMEGPDLEMTPEMKEGFRIGYEAGTADGAFANAASSTFYPDAESFLDSLEVTDHD